MIVIQRTEGHRRHILAVAEEDVAMQVAVIGHRGPLVGTERSELARMIIRIRNLYIFFPHRSSHLGCHEGLDWRLAGEREKVKEYLLLLLLAVGIRHDQGLCLGHLADCRTWRCLLYTSPSPRDGLLSRMP